jgi:sulfatase maturation enzyme AslB (radical SAM superfamily)
MSPLLITSEEMNKVDLTYDFIIERRKQLFYALNSTDQSDAGDCAYCSNVYSTKFGDINFQRLGGGTAINIQHYTTCNLYCTYCVYAIDKNFLEPQYSYQAIIKFIKCFADADKIIYPVWITFSGGEPALLHDFDIFLNDLVSFKNFGICIFSNATVFNNTIYQMLKENKIYLTTSLDAGIPSTFKSMRGRNMLHKVFENLVKYKNSGTTNLWLKYIITENNSDDDDLYAFVFMMAAIKPNKIYVAVDFPYGDKQIPQELSVAAAKLWYLLEKYTGIPLQYYSDVATADSKFGVFFSNMMCEYNKLYDNEPIDKAGIIKTDDSIELLNKINKIYCSPFLRGCIELKDIFHNHSYKLLPQWLYKVMKYTLHKSVYIFDSLRGGGVAYLEIVSEA